MSKITTVVSLCRWLVLGSVYFSPRPDAGGTDECLNYVGGREGEYELLT